jgi:PAS domain S-box-containing protein
MGRSIIDLPITLAVLEPIEILIAIADAALCARVSAAAARLGLVPLEAGDCAEVLALCERRKPKVLVAASRLVTGDGITLVGRICGLSESAEAPAVVLLTKDAQEDIAGYEAGADACLRSPVEQAVLDAALRAAVRRADAQRRVAGSLRQTQAMADAMRDGTFTIDGNGNITWVNAAFGRLFGYAEEDLAGCAIDRLIGAAPHSSAANLCQCLDHLAAAADGTTCELKGWRKDGSSFALEANLSVFTAHDGARGYIGVIRDIDSRRAAEAELAEKTERLVRYHDDQEAQVRLAHEIMARLLDRGGLVDARLSYTVRPAQHFSGDVVVAARSSAGRLYVMLADAMGHGLAAAISLLPAITVFYGMAVRNLPLGMMVGEMNSKLRGAMPVGRFVAAALICIDEEHRTGEIWIGGMPDVLWLDGDGNVIETFVSNRLPLGICDTSPRYARPGFFEWRATGQLFACSDGLGEARNARGEDLESERVLVTLAGADPKRRVASVENAVRDHLAGAAAADDIALLTIDFI